MFFRNMVGRYHGTPFNFDRSRFPASTNGFYHFGSVSNLVAALPHPLCDTDHAYEFNCFDIVIALADTSLRTPVKPDDLIGPYLAPYAPTNGTFFIRPTATARDAYAVAYHSWYREGAESLFPAKLNDIRIALTAALFSCHLLPQSTVETNLQHTTLGVLQSSWRRMRLEFPKGLELVLCHEVHFPQKWLVTAHAGLLLKRNNGYSYIEKSGGKGPFVRLDLSDRQDLVAWLSAMFRGAERFGYTHHFVTFNETRIESLDSLK